MGKIIVELTVQECAALRQLINFAVLAQGMNVAEVAVVLEHKLKDAMDNSMRPPTMSEEIQTIPQVQNGKDAIAP